MQRFPQNPDRPVSFGFKMSWFAVRTGGADNVAKALNLGKGVPCNWKSGIERAYENGGVFIAPPVGNWTLIVGGALTEDDDTEIARRLTELSRRFGEAQWFGTHRVVDYHAWAKSVDGKIVRHYAYSGERGETLRADGDPLPGEPRNLFNSLSPEARSPGYADRSGLAFPSEDTVMAVAGAWSIDPTNLDTRQAPVGLGLLVR